MWKDTIDILYEFQFQTLNELHCFEIYLREDWYLKKDANEPKKLKLYKKKHLIVCDFSIGKKTGKYLW